MAVKIWAEPAPEGGETARMGGVGLLTSTVPRWSQPVSCSERS